MIKLSSKTAAGLLSAAALLFTASCADSQALAEFDGGSITRKELRQIFGGKEENKEITVDVQDRALRGLSVMEIAANEAKKEGLDKTEEFKKAMFMFDEKIQLQAYNYKLMQDAEDGDYDMIFMQFLMLRTPAGDPGRPARMEEARRLVDQLNDSSNSDADIEDIIAKKTENQRYKYIGGYLDPHCISCGQNPLIFLTAPLEKGKLKKFQIIEDENALWIIRSLGTETVSGNELKYAFEKYLRKTKGVAERFAAGLKDEDNEKQQIKQFIMTKEQILKQSEMQADGQIRRESNQPLFRVVEKRKAELNLTLYDAAKPQQRYETFPPAPGELLYSVNGKNFTYADLLKAVEPVGEKNVNQQMNYLNYVLIPLEVLKDLQDFKETKDSYVYGYLHELKKNEILATNYIGKRTESIAVSPEEVRQWYDLRKFNEFKGKTFFQAKPQIEAQLQKMKVQQENARLQDELGKKYNLKVHRDKLVPGRI